MSLNQRFTSWSPAVLLVVMLSWSLPAVRAAEDGLVPLPQETVQERDARMKWWREARFGMFIHWGLYAIPAGFWDGKPVGGIGEWIMDSANIPVPEYEKLAAQFNPVQYDPRQWAQIARDAGVKYIVITSKHHDGFCLFDTAATDWDVVDSTPYGRDLLKPLAEACRAEGIRFCVYHSIMDWHHPSQLPANDQRYNPTRIKTERKQEYVQFMKQQLKELLDSCDPEVLWFDGEWPDWWTENDGRDLYAFLRRLKPELIINNRVGKGRKGMEGMNRGDQEYVGDFGTPEQQIPATGFPLGVDWESCMTMNDTWGFRKDDDNWKSTETLVRNLIDIASKGGNYLLNVGPTAEGRIPEPSVERLAGIGRWMKINGESIYATQANPLPETPWGRCTRKSLEDGKTRLYLHVFDWPAEGKLTISGLRGRPAKAFLLSDDQQTPLSMEADRSTVRLQLPDTMPDKIATVVVLDVEGQLSL